MGTVQIHPQNNYILMNTFISSKLTKFRGIYTCPFAQNRRTSVVRAAKVCDAAQLKQNWLDSLTFPPLHDLTTTQTNADSEWVLGVDPDLSGALAVLKTDQSGCSAQVKRGEWVFVFLGVVMATRHGPGVYLLRVIMVGTFTCLGKEMKAFIVCLIISIMMIRRATSELHIPFSMNILKLNSANIVINWYICGLLLELVINYSVILIFWALAVDKTVWIYYIFCNNW